MSRPTTARPAEYDLIVMGGGFYGAAICWLATQAGLTVGLFERNDYGSGASANSLKTVHGGIRYLQSFNIKRTLKSIRERNRISQWFSHGVKPMRCIMPLYLPTMKNPLIVLLGFKFYQLLSGLVGKAEPLLGATGITRAFANAGIKYHQPLAYGYWHDPQAQYPERMVLEILLAARTRGAQVHNYTRVDSVQPAAEGGLVCNLVSAAGKLEQAKARVVVDCTGGWQQAASHTGSSTQYVRAVNLVVDRHFGPEACTLEGESSSRFLFLCPWQQKTMIGTWYLYQTQESDLSLSEAELGNLLAEVNECLAQPIARADVLNVHVGLLPLTHDPGEELQLGNSLSDECRYFVNPEVNNLFRIEGIKFTTALADSAEVLRQILGSSHFAEAVNRIPSAVDSLPCTLDSVSDFQQRLITSYPWCPSSTLSRLIAIYGKGAEALLSLAADQTELQQEIKGVSHSLIAEIPYVVNREDVCHLSDLVLRRTCIGVVQPPSAATVRHIVQLMAPMQGWDSLAQQQEIEQLWLSYSQVVRPKFDTEETV